jgi:arginyl-tRNA synthetase
MRLKDKVTNIISHAITSWLHENSISLDQIPPVFVEIPKIKEYGDFATNVSMLLTPIVQLPSKTIAMGIASYIKEERDTVEKVEVADPGFINIYLEKKIWYEALRTIIEEGSDYGRIDIGKNKKVQIEYVSANPTGPLHIGHGRGAAIGDVVSNLMKLAGYQVCREYYINDVGNQMLTLGRSVYFRYLELSGKKVEFPLNHYQGSYIREIALAIKNEQNGKYLEMPEEKVVPFFSTYASNYILKGIKKDLEAFGVFFDNWYSETQVFEEGLVSRVLDELKAKDYLYQKDGALWFQATRLGDEKDRVITKADGAPTYFASDIAYHKQKYDRGFDIIINIWGADHHGYVPRIKAVIQALGKDRESLKVILVQLVSLLRDGKPIAMSTRSGEFITLREVIDEVGKDAARYFFLTRRSDSHLDFDLELAKRQNEENPVYYVQYAHARISSIIEFAKSKGIELQQVMGRGIVELLNLPEEITLIKKLSCFPDVIEGCVTFLEPHRITMYLGELVAEFHAYYNKFRIIIDDRELSCARLYLASAIRQVIKNALNILGITAPEKM